MITIIPRIPDIISGKNVVCGFTTRNGGVSSSPFNSLNLGFNTPDESANVEKNHSLIHKFLHIERNRTALMEQVHGSNIAVVSEGGRYPLTDGLITSKPNIMLGVLIADCIPLLLNDSKLNVIGAIHCGWRPIVDGIAKKAIEIFVGQLGSDLSSVTAILGPSAGPCCYEINGELASQLKQSSVIKRNGKLYADLRSELCFNLMRAGINQSNIEVIHDCTICNGSLYFSHRRDGINAGRMMGYIMLKDKN
ncbi:peptidoglycan editing factor PgeF [Candidatus Latescibacterota bacterium]